MLLTDAQIRYWIWPGRSGKDKDGAEWIATEDYRNGDRCRCYCVSEHGEVYRVPRPSQNREYAARSLAFFKERELVMAGYVPWTLDT